MEIAANESIPTALALTTVSKVVHKWITPIIYRTVILRSPDAADSFYHVVKVASCDVAAHVRNLSLEYPFYSPDAILSRCTHTERLVLGVGRRPRRMIIPIGPCPELWEAVLHSHAWKWTALLSLPLQNVTHLYFINWPYNDDPTNFHQTLSKLTHVGFPCIPGGVEVDDALLSSTKQLLLAKPSLDMGILHSFSWDIKPVEEFIGRLWVELAQIQDERLLARPGLMEAEFNELLKSGETSWDNARERFGNWRDAVRLENTIP
jgi:hypothetical protein